MFTGIIRSSGIISDIKYSPSKDAVFYIKTDLNEKNSICIGSSVAINGVCLTVVGIKENILSFDVSAHTLNKTALGDLLKGSKTNLESSLCMGDEIGGHFVYGHVDFVGSVKSFLPQGDCYELIIYYEEKYDPFICPRGSVSIDGVSLTVANKFIIEGRYSFSVAVIPHTKDNTLMSTYLPEKKANIELDMLARYCLSASNIYNKHKKH
jgi:riboflavin synthase